MKNSTQLVVSIVSHGHGHLVTNLLRCIERVCDPGLLKVVITKNIQESIDFAGIDCKNEVIIIENSSPKSFSSNHNFAFESTRPEFFCVVNPDISFGEDPFATLLWALKHTGAGIVSPVVTDPLLRIEDSARRTITPGRIVKRLLWRKRTDYPVGTDPVSPDWVAGMFMLFSAKCFSQLGGFDDKYRMYCEDADICLRAKYEGFKILLIPNVTVVHAAQRTSHRRADYFAWHLNSLCRFYWRHGILAGPLARYVPG